MNEQVLVIAIFLSVIGLFAAIIRLAIGQRRREIERLQRMGFFEVKEPEAGLVDRLAEVMRAGAKKASVGTILRRTAAYYEIYTFLPRSSEGSGMDFAVRVPGLTLPRLRLMRKIAMLGRVGNWLTGLAARVGGLGLGQVDLSAHPDLAERCLVFSDNPSAAAILVTEHWRQYLLEAPDGFAISGAGDVLAFGFQAQLQRKARGKTPQMPGMPSQAEQQFDESVRVIERYIAALRSSPVYAR